jgi:hypothetical protein
MLTFFVLKTTGSLKSITVIVPPPDYQDWEAKVVDVSGFHKWAVLIRGLSGGYFLRDPILTNKYLQVCPHQATVSAVKTHQLELLDQDDSKYEYGLCRCRTPTNEYYRCHEV